MSYRGSFYNQRGGSSLGYGNRSSLSGGNGRGSRPSWNNAPAYGGNSRFSGDFSPRYDGGDFGGGFSSKKYDYYEDDFSNYQPSHRSRYNDSSLNPWESGRPPAKNFSKRALLPTPSQLSGNLMNSVNQLFRMGGTEKQLLNIVQAVVSSQESATSRNSSYNGNQGGNYNRRWNYNSRPYSGNYYSNNDNYYHDNKYDVEQPYLGSSRYDCDYSYDGWVSSHRQASIGAKAKAKQQTKAKPPVLTKKKSATKLSPKSSSQEITSSKEDQEIDRAALHCHICNISNFTSKETYLAHLTGRSHAMVAQVFHSKNNAILQMLRANSKIAEMKQMARVRRGGVAASKTKNTKPVKGKTTAVKTGVKGHSKQSSGTGTMSYVTCYKCMCEVGVPMKRHVKTVEHKQVHNFLSVKCCNKWYGIWNNAGRKDIEEHKLSLFHLRNVHQSKVGSEKDESEAESIEPESNEEDDLAVEASFLEKLRKEEEEKKINNIHKFPPYDSSIMSGICCIRNRVMRYCRACNVQFKSNRMRLELHCRSSEHYDNVLKQLKKEKTDRDKEKEIVQANGKEGEENDDKFDEAVEDLETESSTEKSDDETNEEGSENVEECAVESPEEVPVKELENGVLNLNLKEKDIKDMPVSWSDATEQELQNGNGRVEE